MKNLLLCLVMCGLLAACNMAPYCGGKTPQTAQEPQFFRVSADAEVRVKPNRASLTLGVFEHTADLKQGRETMQKTIAAAVAYCEKNGVENKSIQTQNIRITPIYDTRTKYTKNGFQEQTEVRQYELTQTFTVTLDDPAQYENLLYGLLDLGINRVEEISFYSSDMRQYRDEARLMAVEHAKEKAALLAKAAGVTLGPVVNVSEETFSNYYRGPSNFSQNVVTEAPAGESGPATGMISVKAGVSLVYRLQTPPAVPAEKAQ